MKRSVNKTGSVMLITIFVIAVIAVLISGMLAVSTEHLQLWNNQLYSTQAMQVAEAGLNDAMASLRSDPNWNTGFTGKTFWIGSYTVDVNNTDLPTIVIKSVGTANGYTANMIAKATIAQSSPRIIRIDNLRVNSYE
ncbi:MAG: hypothetical protein A2Y07_00410 [Planctomycetes bacterium GWF2_50_10]|nr:MAG: hypothetical protein A2Y07_00410 [Planctomycetes bacterium GWF2_50_10]